MYKLKPCPFCGRMPIKFEHSMDFLQSSSQHFLEVKCSCGFTFKKEWRDIPLSRLNELPSIAFGADKAVDIWNTRTQEKGAIHNGRTQH